MKKVLMSVLALVALSGCANYYDYYKSGVRYTQDGDDCIFYSAERGRYFSDEIRALDADKKIVYKNIKCETLYGRDMIGQMPRHDRKIVVPAAKKNCPCKKSCKYVKVN